MKKAILVLALLALTSCAYLSSEAESSNYPELVDGKANLTPSEWKDRLTALEYYVLWKKGTEAPFTGKHYDNKEEGVYVTAGCGIPVFSSEHKYNSTTGWPSFWRPLNESNVILKEDNSFGMNRIEVLSKCGEHLGHVFNDGPEPTGKRWCINSAALDFVPANQ